VTQSPDGSTGHFHKGDSAAHNAAERATTFGAFVDLFERVLSRMAVAGMSLKGAKCELLLPEVNVLGFVATPHGLQLQKPKIEEIMMPTNASEPVQEHGDGVRRGRRVRCHLRAQKWHRKWWWCAARASHGPRPATAGLCQSWWTRSCRTLSSRWRKLCPPIGASFRSSRDSVCAMRGFKSRWYLHSSGEHTVAHGR
jgi:hypothetical protein